MDDMERDIVLNRFLPISLPPESYCSLDNAPADLSIAVLPSHIHSQISWSSVYRQQNALLLNSSLSADNVYGSEQKEPLNLTTRSSQLSFSLTPREYPPFHQFSPNSYTPNSNRRISPGDRSPIGTKSLSQGRRSSGHRPAGRAVKKLSFEDEAMRSPVSGARIRRVAAAEVVSGSAGRLGVNGEFACSLCRGVFPDPIGLASHCCPGIELLDYRCDQCEKTFNCPANLASHRRWHRTPPTTAETDHSTATEPAVDPPYQS